MLDYTAIHDKAREWASHRRPKHSSGEACIAAVFVTSSISILSLGIAGVSDSARYSATFWTTLIVGAGVYLWFRQQEKQYEKLYRSFYDMLVQEAEEARKEPEPPRRMVPEDENWWEP